ncbi:MAG: response regulator [Roseibium sp.]
MVVHIVEDDPAVADALAMAITNLDHFPKTYIDGETFLAQAPVSEADVVILDLGLPGMSGVEVAQKLSALQHPPRMIAISGKSHTRLQQHLKKLPSLRVLRKPLSMDTLAEAIS